MAQETFAESGPVSFSFEGVGAQFGATSASLGNCAVSCDAGDGSAQAGYSGNFSLTVTALATAGDPDQLGLASTYLAFPPTTVQEISSFGISELVPIPEPATFALIGCGLVCFGLLGRRNRGFVSRGAVVRRPITLLSPVVKQMLPGRNTS
jgi:hypothetical protein